MSKYIGNRQFYKNTLQVAVPIMVQNAVTNFVSLLDNVMIGQCGLEAISGVAIISQLMFVFYVTIFGATSGPGLFCAQYYGARDEAGLRTAFRFKLFATITVCLLGMLTVSLWQEQLISFYLHDTGDGGDPALMMDYARRYLGIMLWGLPAFSISQSYASTLREVGRPQVPMLASVVAVTVNLTGNWLLIFGKLGCPELGIIGAAIATVASRWVEMLIVTVWSHRHSREVLFSHRTYRHLRLNLQLDRSFFIKSFPLFCNELLWSLGQACLMQLYSRRGLNVVPALNIAYVFLDLCDVVCFSMGSAIGIIIGQLLGAGKLDDAVESDRKLIVFTVLLSVAVGGVMALCSGFFPLLYDVPTVVRNLASHVILICGLAFPLMVLPHACYFTLRSGGKTFITFLFDSFFSWSVNIPVVYLLIRFTGLPLEGIYVCSALTNIIKCVVGCILVKRKVWVVNMAQNGAN